MDEERMETPQERLRQLDCPDPREVVEIYQGDGVSAFLPEEAGR